MTLGQHLLDMTEKGILERSWFKLMDLRMILHLPLSTSSSVQEVPSLQMLVFPNPVKDLVRPTEPKMHFAHEFLHH